MSYYELLVFIHVLAAIVWAGSELYVHFQGARAQARGPEAEAAFALDFMRWGNTALPGAAMLLVITGVLGVIEGPWEFSQAWVSIGLTVWVILFIVGIAYYGPQGKKLSGYLEEDGGVVTERSAPVLRQVMLVSRVELLLLLVVIFTMVTKPGI